MQAASLVQYHRTISGREKLFQPPGSKVIRKFFGEKHRKIIPPLSHLNDFAQEESKDSCFCFVKAKPTPFFNQDF